MKTKVLSIVIIAVALLIGSLSASAQNQNGFYREYKKNEKGQPTEVVTYRGEGDQNLQPVKKTVYLYNGDVMSQKMVYTWDVFTNKWVEQSKIDFTHNIDAQLTSATQQLWDNKSSDWSKSKEHMAYRADSTSILLTEK